MARNDFVTAVALTETAIERDRDSPQYVLDLAFLFVDLDDRAEAARLVQSAHKRWPDATDVELWSSVLRLLEGDAESARRGALEILGQSPKGYQALGLLSMASAMTGTLGSAREHWARAFREFFGNGAPEVHAGNNSRAIDAAAVLLAAGERGAA